MADQTPFANTSSLPPGHILLSRYGFELTPNRLLFILAAVNFIAEICAMLILTTLPEMSDWAEALLDASILLLIMSPAYFFLYRPFWQERQHAEEEIRRLSRQLIRAEEATRKALARDLHDEFGQTLGALQLGIETMKVTLPAGEENLAAQCDRLSHMTAQLGAQVRDVTAQLRPAMLDNLGLIPTLRWHLHQFQLRHPRMMIIMNLPEQDIELPPDVAIVLYRVVQESLNNIIKHAHANRVELGMKHEEGEVSLFIKDNGVGFAMADGKPAGDEGVARVGLLGMRERIADIGGRLHIDSQAGRGVVIEAVLTLPAEEPQ